MCDEFSLFLYHLSLSMYVVCDVLQVIHRYTVLFLPGIVLLVQLAQPCEIKIEETSHRLHANG